MRNTANRSLLTTAAWIGKLPQKPGIAKTNRILNIFEPTIAPTAISAWPLSALVTDAANSGRLVPTATMVSPMTSSDTPNERAMLEAAQTKRRDEAMSNKSPPRKLSQAAGIVISRIWVISLLMSGFFACCAILMKKSPRAPTRMRLSVRDNSRS